tara:strand:+ start:143 stop:472 length:330 start_codon:yes stop_codon:yes gene_type:complete
MMKYFKISVSDADHLIPIQSILGIEVGASTEVDILYNVKGHGATGASEVLGVKLTATTADDAAKTKEQVNSIVDAMEDALSTAWTKPFYVLEPKYAVTSISQIEEEWSA